MAAKSAPGTGTSLMAAPKHDWMMLSRARSLTAKKSLWTTNAP